MQTNLRLYIRCIHRIIIEENIFLFFYKCLKKIIRLNFELINTPKKISKNLLESTQKFQKAKKIIDSNSKASQSNFFNLVK